MHTKWCAAAITVLLFQCLKLQARERETVDLLQ